MSTNYVDVHEGALAAAARPHDGDKLTAGYLQVDIKEDGGLERAAGEGLAELFGFD